jgi:hypothetical protein
MFDDDKKRKMIRKEFPETNLSPPGKTERQQRKKP